MPRTEARRGRILIAPMIYKGLLETPSDPMLATTSHSWWLCNQSLGTSAVTHLLALVT
jgi:hypothetical protein